MKVVSFDTPTSRFILLLLFVSSLAYPQRSTIFVYEGVAPEEVVQCDVFQVGPYHHPHEIWSIKLR